MTARNAEIVQAARNLHDQIRDAFFGQAQDIFDNPAAFDAGDGVFDHHSCAGEDRVEKFLAHAQFFAPRLFFGCVVSVASGS